MRYWTRVEQVMDDETKLYSLRVVTLGDGETVHNACFDRNYREAE